MATTTETGRLAGRVALITGGSRGIGAAIACAFAAEGADVAFCHWQDEAGAIATATTIEAMGRRTFHGECDIADVEASRHFVARAAGTLGPIDILVNNAGIDVPCAFENLKVADFDRMIGIHLRGAFFVTQAVYPMMKERGWGRIINMSSTLAHRGAEEKTHYCAAKAGLLGFTRALAREAAPHGVLVNAIGPGPIDTAMTQGQGAEWRAARARQLPVGRFGKPEDVAPTAVLMASDDAGFMAGAFVMLNGGDTMV